MIIKNQWMTSRRVRINFGKEHYSEKLTKWQGWFLFGIIPLYVRVMSYTYQ